MDTEEEGCWDDDVEKTAENECTERRRGGAGGVIGEGRVREGEERLGKWAGEEMCQGKVAILFLPLSYWEPLFS